MSPQPTEEAHTPAVAASTAQQTSYEVLGCRGTHGGWPLPSMEETARLMDGQTLLVGIVRSTRNANATPLTPTTPTKLKD